MLPETYFDRLTHAMGARTYRRGGERRRAIRIPSSFRPTLFPVVSGCVLRPHRVRARDISMGGIGLLLPRALASTKLAVLHIKPEAADDAFVILCALQRSLKLDSSWIAQARQQLDGRRLHVRALASPRALHRARPARV
jgi:hypothetical protein